MRPAATPALALASCASVPRAPSDHVGRRAYRFEASGPALGGRGGPLWFDAADGHIIEARWGVPNHSEDRDFVLRLSGISDGGGRTWRRLLEAHFAGCPEGN